MNEIPGGGITYEIPIDFVEPKSDRKFIDEVIAGERLTTIISQSRAAEELASSNGLEIVDAEKHAWFNQEMAKDRELSDLFLYAIGRKQEIGSLLDGRLDKIDVDSATKLKAERLLESVKKLTPANAVKLLISIPFESRGMESVEIAIIEGLLYGFKERDINYYIDTRYLKALRYDEEGFHNKIALEGLPHVEHVVCAKCANEYLSG